MYKDRHYSEYEDQAEDQPCICEKLEQISEARQYDLEEAEATGN